MGHRGQRSEEAEIRRAIRTIILDAAFNDRIIKEKVSQTTSQQVLEQFVKLYPKLAEGISLSVLEEAMPGLVLTDSYGQGWFQTC